MKCSKRLKAKGEEYGCGNVGRYTVNGEVFCKEHAALKMFWIARDSPTVAVTINFDEVEEEEK